jgi:hypothetical protein
MYIKSTGPPTRKLELQVICREQKRRPERRCYLMSMMEGEKESKVKCFYYPSVQPEARAELMPHLTTDIAIMSRGRNM